MERSNKIKVRVREACKTKRTRTMKRTRMGMIAVTRGWQMEGDMRMEGAMPMTRTLVVLTKTVTF
jgi:hypothetical protein